MLVHERFLCAQHNSEHSHHVGLTYTVDGQGNLLEPKRVHLTSKLSNSSRYCHTRDISGARMDKQETPIPSANSKSSNRVPPIC